MPKDSFQKQATYVSMVSIFGNLLLTTLKFLAGLFGNSQAMISDAIHSSSDVVSSIIVIVGVKISAKSSDNEHPYGHERLECVAAVILSVILAITGATIGYVALLEIWHGDYRTNAIPGLLPLIMAVVSIAVKESMYWFTRHYAKKLDSTALMADAWHHRSDALSSIGALIGIGGARLGYPIMDPIASIVICIFICKAAFEIFKDAMDKMVDKSCDDETQDLIKAEVMKNKGVERIDFFQTRLFGNRIYVDLEIAVNGDMSFRDAHAISENVHASLEATFPKIKHIMIHVNPAD